MDGRIDLKTLGLRTSSDRTILTLRDTYTDKAQVFNISGTRYFWINLFCGLGPVFFGVSFGPLGFSVNNGLYIMCAINNIFFLFAFLLHCVCLLSRNNERTTLVCGSSYLLPTPLFDYQISCFLFLFCVNLKSGTFVNRRPENHAFLTLLLEICFTSSFGWWLGIRIFHRFFTCFWTKFKFICYT